MASPPTVSTIPAPLSRLIATSQVPLTLAAPNGRDFPLVAANAAFERLTGYEQSDLLGRDCRLLQGVRTQPAARAALRHALDEGLEGQAVITNYRRNGEEFGNFVFLNAISTKEGTAYVLGSQFEIAVEDRTRSFERHGEFLLNALDEVEKALGDGYLLERELLSRHDRRALVRRRLRNWALS